MITKSGKLGEGVTQISDVTHFVFLMIIYYTS